MLSSSLQSVLDLQSSYSAQSTPEMTRRRELVEAELVNLLRQSLAGRQSGAPWKVNGSSGIGNNSKVPWVRIFDPAQSKNAQSGWYLVFLFSADGSTVNLSLDLGVTKLSASEVKGLRQSALNLLGLPDENRNAPNPEFQVDEIDLHDSGLGRKYEEGHVTGFSYASGAIPGDEIIFEQVAWLLEMLSLLPREGEVLSISQSDELSTFIEVTGWSKSRSAQVLESLSDASPQIILAGPPGTGKTYVARELAKYLLSDSAGSFVDDRISIVQFHPSYGYEDFVEGLRPVPSENGLLEFRNVPGIVLGLSKMIEQDAKPRVLIIDEMNRANLPRVFGELMYLLEYRDSEINLMYHGKFSLPRQLYIIGTMNTADRSIKNLDLALRRRFDFFEVQPEVDVLRKHYLSRKNDLGEGLFSGFEKLNEQIASDMLDRHHGVGHSYFMKDHMSLVQLRNIWELQIAPLLEDYFFDRSNPLEGYTLDTFWS